MRTLDTSEPRTRNAVSIRREAHGPRGLPVLGHLIDLARDPLGFLSDCAREYGDVVALRLGTWPTLLISDPELIETILVKDHRSFVKNSFFWRQVTAVFGSGLLTSEGEFWQRQRRLAAPAFAGKRLATYGDVMVHHTQRMLDGWRTGVGRDLHADMMGLTLKIAAKTLFGSDVHEDVVEIDQAVNDLADEMASRMARPFVIPDAVPLPGHLRYRRGLRKIQQVIARIVNERRVRNEDAGDLLSMLMLARDEHGHPMSDRQLRDEAITILLAGHETTALALSWTWVLLAGHPDVQAELAGEVSDVLGGRAATVEDLPRLRFAEQVVTEAMRLYPPAWLIGREALRDCEIGGYPVHTGTTIYMSPWVVHRNPRYFEQPEEYRPGRWAGGLGRRLPRFAYFPFGGGPRICIGNRFAMMEAVLILATIVQRFRIERQKDRPVIPLPSITLRPKTGVWVVPATRH
jgi:cytochrome P450